MPSRVIDVFPGQVSNVKEDRVCLVSTKDLSPLCKYATLSHCWGGQVAVQLKGETRSQLSSGYLVDSLPRTFADAVRITRRLGLRYVWIDSLCIEQDSEEDWRKESQTMDQVYSHSWCNIAASASKDSSVGCFFNWNTKFAQPFEADTLWTGDLDRHRTFVPHTFLRKEMWSTYVYEDVLDQRGWVMQERILPARQLSFTKAGVFWECRCLLANPHLPEKFPPDDQRHFYKDFPKKLEELATNQPPVSIWDRENASITRHHKIQKIHRAWNHILEAYSRGKLTKATDRLVAISGLAKKMREVVGDEYLAGLWKSRFFPQLCWSVNVSEDEFFHSLRRPRPLLAPTWSWASTLQPIKTEWISETTNRLSEVLEVDLQHPTHDSTGEVIGGFLRLRTVLEPVNLSQSDNKPGCRFSFQAWMMPATGILDEKFTEQETCGKTFCIPLYHAKYLEVILGILLRSTCGRQSGYERIGSWKSNFNSPEAAQLSIEAEEDFVAKRMRMAESWINELRDVSEKGTTPSYQDIVIY